MEIKERFADKLVNCDTYFESDQLVAILDICDELGIPEMYEALKSIADGPWSISSAREIAEIALARAEGKC